MPLYRGMPGPRSGSRWVEEWVGEPVGDFCDSIGNVNEINTPPQKKPQNHTIIVFSSYLVQDYFSPRFHTFTCKFHDLFLNGCVIFHCIKLPHFLYPFIC
jgi:hypothetical protein